MTETYPPRTDVTYWETHFHHNDAGLLDDLRLPNNDEAHHIVRDGCVRVSTGGAPLWVHVADAQVLALAERLAPEAFDADVERTTARCMVPGWGDQAPMRAVMEHGTDRFRTLVDAQVAVWFLNGTPAPAYCRFPRCHEVTAGGADGARVATANGWFFERDGDTWCPRHVPHWVENWRATRHLPPEQRPRQPYRAEDYLTADDHYDESPQEF